MCCVPELSALQSFDMASGIDLACICMHCGSARSCIAAPGFGLVVCQGLAKGLAEACCGAAVLEPGNSWSMRSSKCCLPGTPVDHTHPQ